MRLRDRKTHHSIDFIHLPCNLFIRIPLFNRAWKTLQRLHKDWNQGGGAKPSKIHVNGRSFAFKEQNQVKNHDSGNSRPSLAQALACNERVKGVSKRNL